MKSKNEVFSISHSTSDHNFAWNANHSICLHARIQDIWKQDPSSGHQKMMFQGLKGIMETLLGKTSFVYCVRLFRMADGQENGYDGLVRYQCFKSKTAFSRGWAKNIDRHSKKAPKELFFWIARGVMWFSHYRKANILCSQAKAETPEKRQCSELPIALQSRDSPTHESEVIWEISKKYAGTFKWWKSWYSDD